MNRLSELVLFVKGETNEGGNPISISDFNIISEKIQSIKSKSIHNELCYILFNLASTTKLRLGEITNLEVNCIVYKDESTQTGKISYYSKLSGNVLVTEILPLEKINLLERAIDLSNPARSEAQTDIRRYVFLSETKKKSLIKRFGGTFAYFFRKILNELNDKLENDYSPYDLRDTFIDTIFSQGIQSGIDTLTITEMTGNKASTALKYYRKKHDIKRYAEAFSGITITDVETNGDIIQDKDITILNPVKGDLGGCKETECVKLRIISEEEYECLTCSFFATSLSRLSHFRNKIKTLKEQKENSNNSKEKEFLDLELTLTTAYYVKLLESKGQKNGS